MKPIHVVDVSGPAEVRPASPGTAEPPMGDVDTVDLETRGPVIEAEPAKAGPARSDPEPAQATTAAADPGTSGNVSATSMLLVLAGLLVVAIGLVVSQVWPDDAPDDTAGPASRAAVPVVVEAKPPPADAVPRPSASSEATPSTAPMMPAPPRASTPEPPRASAPEPSRASTPEPERVKSATARPPARKPDPGPAKAPSTAERRLDIPY